jgi:hypothetical protein
MHPAMTQATPSALTPYLQISKVIWRSLGLSQARWLYVALACCLTITAVGGGISWKWGLAALRDAAAITTVICLQISWSFVCATLMRLNTPTAARTVPNYVGRLRRTALVLWLGICTVTGLLEGNSIGEAGFMAFSAGVVMLFISTPWRWPVQWCLFLSLLVFLGGRSHVVVESALVQTIFSSPASGLAFAITCFLGMAWLVTRLIATDGSRFSAVFSRSVQIQNATPGSETPARLPAHALGPLVGILQRGLQWLLFPWRLYLRHALDRPRSATDQAPHTAQVLSRALLGLGPNIHWVMQVCTVVALWAAVLLVVVIVPLSLGSGARAISGGWAIVIAMGSLMLAIAPLLSLPETLRETAPEQKLMLLLPGMPRGKELNRMLAVRHLRHAFIAWLLAAVSVAALPYPDKDLMFVGSFYLGALVMLPMVISDWARIQAPNALSALAGLLWPLVAPAAGLTGLLMLQLPASGIACAAVVCALIVLTVRWNRAAHFAQALPAGRLGRRETERDV